MKDRTLVVGIDGSPSAQEALRWTVRLTSTLGGEIVVAHAVGLLEERLTTKVADVVERDWCASLRGGRVPSRIVVRDGNPVDVLVEVARETAADLVVVGTRGTGRRSALALGSTSMHLLQVAPCPVLVVPGDEAARLHRRLQRILAAVDGTPESSATVDCATEMAEAFGAWVEIVHAVEDVDVFPLGPATATSSEGEWDAPMRAAIRLDPLRRRVSERGIPARLRVERGAPEDVVADTAAAIDADLVVLASRHVDDPAQELLAGVSRQVVRIAHRPTSVLPVRAHAAA